MFQKVLAWTGLPTRLAGNKIKKMAFNCNKIKVPIIKIAAFPKLTINIGEILYIFSWLFFSGVFILSVWFE